MPDEALLDAVDETVDQSAESTDQSTDTSSADVSQDIEITETQTDSAPVVADANGQLRLSEATKAELDKIKAENPRLAREMRAALFDRQTLVSKGLTVKQALETIDAYEAEGGSEAVHQAKEELGQWKQLDEDFQAAKPEFVNDIAAGNPEAFVKLGPVVMSKLAEMAPEVFSHEVSKVFAQDMAASEIPMQLKLLRRAIEDPANPGKVKPGMEDVTEFYNAVQGYVNKITGLAQNAPKQEAKASTTQTPEVESREQQLTIREFGAERAAVKDAITKTEFEKNAAGRKLSAEKVSTIQELYESSLNRLVQAIPGHKAKVDRFVAAKDKTGYRKHVEAAIRSKAPEAMAQAFRRAGVGAKPGPQPVKKPATTAVTKPVTATAGFTRTGTKPDRNQINWQATNSVRRTAADSNKYVMRNGDKLLWQR